MFQMNEGINNLINDKTLRLSTGKKIKFLISEKVKTKG